MGMLRLGGPRSDFNVREFPQMRIHNTGAALLDEKTPVPLDNKRDKMPRRSRRTSAEVGQFFYAIFAKGNAEYFNRANLALWIAWRAYQCTQFHERLVEMGTGA